MDILQNYSGKTELQRESVDSHGVNLSCNKLYRSPWPSIDFAEAKNTALDLLPNGEIVLFNHFPARRLAWQEPESGWHVYRFGVKPEWVEPGEIYTLYETSIGSTSESLLASAFVQPSDRAFSG